MVRHCSTNAEATGSNPIEGPKNVFFFGLLRNCLKCDSTAMVTSGILPLQLNFCQIALGNEDVEGWGGGGEEGEHCIVLVTLSGEL